MCITGCGTLTGKGTNGFKIHTWLTGSETMSINAHLFYNYPQIKFKKDPDSFTPKIMHKYVEICVRTAPVLNPAL